MSILETRFFIRMAAPADVRECHEIDVEAWGSEAAATEEMLHARIARYPFGNFVAIDRASGRIVGSVWSVATDEREITTWWEASGYGAYERVVSLNGDVAYGVNVSVRPSAAGQGAGELLVSRAVEAGWIAGRRIALLGTRIPHYRKWSQIFAVEDYVHMQRKSDGSLWFLDPTTGSMRSGPSEDGLLGAGKHVDPRAWPDRYRIDHGSKPLDGELGFFLSLTVQGRRCRIYRPLPGYFPDPDSCNYGVLIGWENTEHPKHGLP